MTGSAYQIRKPLASEAEELTRISLASKQFWGYSNDFIDSCKEELAITAQKLQMPQYQFKLLEYNGVVAGFYCLEKHAETRFELEALFIAPQFIGAGLGKRLWQNMVMCARQSGAQTVAIASDPNAEEFYLKMGAVRVAEIPSQSISGRFLPLLEYYL